MKCDVILAGVGGQGVLSVSATIAYSALREGLKLGLAEAGLPKGAVHAEAFEIRTGLGLRRLSAWLLDRALARGEIRGPGAGRAP